MPIHTLSVLLQARSGDLRQVLARLQLPSMESPDSLIAAAEVAGFELIEFEDTTPSLVQHFTSILEVRLQCSTTLLIVRVRLIIGADSAIL